MSPSDDAPTLRSRLVAAWRAELFSADTVVALVATAVALPAGVLAAVALDAAPVVYPVWLATASAPGLGYWGGRRITIDYRTAARVGAAMAAAVALVTTGAYAAVATLSDATTALLVAGVVGLLFGGLASRWAFARFDG